MSSSDSRDPGSCGQVCMVEVFARVLIAEPFNRRFHFRGGADLMLAPPARTI